MKRYFKKLSIRTKLVLIGGIPLLFIIILVVQQFTEKTEKARLFKSYIERLQRSADISGLLSQLQTERKMSFDHALQHDMQKALDAQRPVTDSLLNRMSLYDETLEEFASYTFLDRLDETRKAIDRHLVPPGMVMDYYTNAIFRINTLNTLPTGSYIYLRPVYKDLVAQKLLNEIVTYMGIISANIYNALYTRQYATEILMGTAGVYQVYKTFEKELLLKATSAVSDQYRNAKSNISLLQARQYIDTLFKRFKFDSSYNHIQWATISSEGIEQLRSLQQELLGRSMSTITTIYRKERLGIIRTLALLVLSILLVTALVVYSIVYITRALNELTSAAGKIAHGIPVEHFSDLPRGSIGELGHSIEEIDINNKQLANAAHKIGQGDFNVVVNPRSPGDILGNAIVEMKKNLQRNTEDLKASNIELERFAYVASHDLQEPLRMVSSFLHLLERKMEGKLDESSRQYITFAIDGAERMKVLIQDLLQYSRVSTSRESVADVDCNEIMQSVRSLLALSIQETHAKLEVHELPVIKAVQPQVLQLFQNLVANALKYHGEKRPEIEVGYLSKNGMYEFYVKDNGIGIDPKFYDRIFIIFQRLHNKAEYSGTGIGLSICKKIVEKHGGKIRVESEPGKGATFYFTLPRGRK
jgi:signal transduction histidine kinase